MKSIKRIPLSLAVLSLMLGLVGPSSVLAAGPATVNLLSSTNFAVLAKAGISTTGATHIIGDIGVSPAAATAITGFGLVLPASSAYATSSLVQGKVYAPGYASPTPANMTTAVNDMQNAYTDAAGRTNPTATELGAGNIGGLTIAPGVYKWGTGVTIPSDVTLSGGANDVWIFQVSQTLNISSGKKVILSGGAQAGNVFWVVGGDTTIGTTAVFYGTILDKTAIALNTGAVLYGRAMAQTAVTLEANSIYTPTSSVPVEPTPPVTTPPVNAPVTTPPPTTPPSNSTPSGDVNVNGAYSASSAMQNTPTIDIDKTLPAAPGGNCIDGTLIKASSAAIYYCGKNGKRYVFVNQKVYFSWYKDFSGVTMVSDSKLASIPIGGNVTYRPGTRMVKIQSDPRVYVVAQGGTLRVIPDEATAKALFGANWNKMIDDISDAFFINYTVGTAVPIQY